jgi:hypothetical protein
MAQVWRYPLLPLTASAPTGVTAAALTASGCNPLPQLPPVTVQGARLSLRATGELTSTSATPTVVLGFYMGSVGQAIGSKTALCASAALAISASATAWPFILEYDGTIRTESSSAGVIHGQGIATSWVNVGLTGTGVANPMPTTAALRTVSTLNFSQVNEIDVGITLSVTTGAPSVTVTDLWAELSG